MYLPPLQPPQFLHVPPRGDVRVHESALIGPGVLLQADPGSQIVIGAGVCVGMGSILHAHSGSLELDAGVIVGAGVLLLGHGHFGANACVGSACTIYNGSIPGQAVIAPGSVIGLGTPPEAAVEAAPEPAATPASPPPAQTVVYGRVHIDHLLTTLLPHRHLGVNHES